MIPHSRPAISIEEITAAENVLKSGMVSQGEQVTVFETELADFLRVKGAVAVSSGTAALHLVLLALGANAQTTIHIPSYVCTALLNAINYCGAKHSICDVSKPIGNLSLDDLKKRIVNDEDIVILPYMFGAPGPIREIKSMNLRVIEDCAQSIGATINGDKLGAIGEVSIFSFYATKVICAGEGGAVASKSEELLDKVRDLRDYDHKLHYQLRFNYKMTDIQAGIARAQLKKLPDFIARRRTIAKMYNTAITSAGGNPLIRSQEDIYFRYLVKVRDIPTSIALFRKEGVCAERPVFQPIHRLLGLEGYNITEKLQNSLISLPCYPALSPGEIDTICKVLSKLGSACEK